jgi:ABC-type branched-subunit amino acid transport system ATPase component
MLMGTDLADQFNFWTSFWRKKGVDFENDFAELMDIAGFKVKWDSQISGMPYGRRKLLEIVRAMLSRPKVMLVDEPAAGLNLKEIERAVALLRLAAEKRGVGVVLIEHSMDMVMNTCHNIVVLNFGRLIAEGTPESVSSNRDVIEAYLGRDFYAED